MASRLSGVGVHTIRAWEKRYSAIVPLRSSTGRRKYSKENIEKLKLLSDLSILGNNIGSMAHLSIEELESMIGQVNKHYANSNRTIPENQTINTDNSLDKLLMALQFYKLDVIGHELEKLKMSLSPKDMALKIVSPLLYEVGVKVEKGNFSISQ